MCPGEADPPPDAGIVGQRLGEFRLVRKLGQGSMGEVYLAMQESLGRLVALKVLRPHLTRSVLQVERFRREASAAARLKHPGIVQVYAVGHEGDTHFFAMEYVEGTNLQEVERGSKAPIDVELCARITSEVGDALAYAHEHGVIHRDVKPQNILIGNDGRARLADFGLAKDASELSLSSEGDIAGTPYYMSPEQALAKRVKIDHRTDVFSLGVVLYELLTRRRPFEGHSSQEVLYQITFHVPRPVRAVNPRVPNDLAVICAKAMEKNPNDRFATAQEMADDLRRFLAREAIHAQPPSMMQRVARFTRRNRIAVATAAAAVAALAVGVVASQVWSSREAMPHVTIVSADAADAGARVFARRIDLASSKVEPGDVVELGTLPIENRALDPGIYRFVVERPGFGFAETTEWLMEHDPPRELRMRIRRTDEIAGSSMQRIPAGEFVYGCAEFTLLQLKKRMETLPAFLIDDHQVSNREYRSFVDDTNHERPTYWGASYKPEWDELPVVAITQRDASDFAMWTGKRLPTVLEWERAARGDKGALFPWPKDFEPSGACAPWADAPRDHPTTEEQKLAEYARCARPVKSCEETRGPHRLFHTFGNVWEFTETAAMHPSDGAGAPVRGRCLLKGGSWRFSPAGCALDRFKSEATGERSIDVGFRCAKSVIP